MNVNQNHGNIDSLEDLPLVASCSGLQVQSSMVGLSSGRTTRRSSRKKCHGNKKLQRFRKRRRAHGMSEKAINKIIQARKREKEKHEAKKEQQQQQKKTTTSDTTQSIRTTNNIIAKPQGQRPEVSNEIKQGSMAPMSMKRKRDVSSQELNRHLATTTTAASSSNHQMANTQLPTKKKLKKTPFIQSIPLNSISVNKNYPLPSYLCQSPHLIFQALSQQLNCPLNKKNEKMFIHLRLQLFDRQYRLDVDRHLWESYLNLGCKEKFWPDQLYTMAKTDEPEMCQTFVMAQLTNIKHQLNECNLELIRQAQSSSSSSSILILLPAIDTIDNCLKEYVSLQQKYLFKRIEHQLNTYKDDIHDRKLYHQLSAYNLSTVQQQAIQQLIHLHQAQFQVYEEFIMLKQRIIHQFLPPNFDQFEQVIAHDDFYTPLVEDQTFVEMKTRRRKILQKGKRTILNIYVYAYQFKIKDYEQQCEQALNEFELKFTSNTITTIDGLTLYQAVKAYLIHRTDHMKKEIQDKISHFRQIIARHRQRSSLAKKMVGVSPEIIINVHQHILNADELTYLSRDENYIRPNQSAIRPYKHRESQIQKELKDIKDKVTQQLTKYCKRTPPKAVLDRYEELLENRLRLRFMAPLSFVDQMRAQREHNLVKSIRRKLRKGQLILRVCDKGGGFHISTKADYERKAAEYRQETNAYEEIPDNPLQELITNVTNVLKELRDSKQLPIYRYNALVPNPDKVKQSYMYLNPKAHKEGVPLRPIMNTIHAVTRAISELLDEIIRPIYNIYSKDNTIIDSVNLIKRLEKYEADGQLKPSTLFCTFDIKNLFTMLPQDQAIEILGQFLRAYAGEYINGLSVTTIQKLTEIVLKQNAFVCNNKFYKQVVGGAMGSPFTLTLANIFMFHWEQRWIRRQNNHQEIYGRYIDDVFFTSNESIEIIQTLLEDANTWHSNIKLQSQIGTSLPFLDVLVSNREGVLHTEVYHKPSAEPYVVPFISDHPRHTFANVIQTALVRAVRYSSTFETFIKEQVAVELMLLYNGYPTTYIDKQFRKVFAEYVPDSSLLSILVDENQFHRFRRKLMDQPTPRQNQIETQIAKYKQDNVHSTVQQTKQALPLAPNTNQQSSKKKSGQDYVLIHITHENRFTSMKRDMHEIFREAFKSLGIEAVRLIVGHRNSPTLQRELIRKRPHMKYMILNGSDSKKKSTKRPKE